MTIPNKSKRHELDWQKLVDPYHKPVLWRSIWQVINSLVPYLLCWYLMYLSLDISYWLTLLIGVLAAGFSTRSFIIFHDCGHGSFFRSKKANEIVGFITGVVTFTPFSRWWHEHAIHHATAGDLDRRLIGDIWTLTLDEYVELPFWKRVGYRLYRNPLIMFGIGGLYIFLIHYRLPNAELSPRERRSVHLTNIALLAIATTLGLLVGFSNYLLIQLPIMALSCSFGVWLFYVQHQYDGVYWERKENWDYVAVALDGSSFYKLPKVLQWFSGNIGFHHIHHLSPRIPNYFLEKCHRENPEFQKVRAVTFWSGFKSLTFRLWDEKRQKLISFREMRLQQKHNAIRT